MAALGEHLNQQAVALSPGVAGTLLTPLGTGGTPQEPARNGSSGVNRVVSSASQASHVSTQSDSD